MLIFLQLGMMVNGKRGGPMGHVGAQWGKWMELCPIMDGIVPNGAG